MTISSRTPEGEPIHCPICQADVVIEPSVVFGDATCPNCGSLLWFLAVGSQPQIFEYARSSGIRERVLAIVAEQLGVDPASLFTHLSTDSLDTVELVMQLEEEFDLQ